MTPDDSTPPVDMEELSPLDGRMRFIMQMLRVLFRLATSAPETIATVAKARAALRTEDVVFVGRPGPFGLVDDFGDDDSGTAFRSEIAAAEDMALSLFFNIRHDNHCGFAECCGPVPLLDPLKPHWVQAARDGKIAEPYEAPVLVEGRQRFRKRGAANPILIVSSSAEEWVEDRGGNGHTLATVTLVPEDGGVLVEMDEADLLAEWERVLPDATTED